MSNPTSGSFGESLPQQINRYILKQIIEGKLKAGDKIVEEEISRESNTSRAPVREALYLLQIDGIVERLPRKGTIVQEFSTKDIDDYLTTLIGIIQLGIDLAKVNWTEENRVVFKNLFLEAERKYNEHHIIDYQYKAEKLFRYIVHLADNVALTRFYEEADHILNVFAQVQMNEETMKEFHIKMQEFMEAILRLDFEEAKIRLNEAIQEGSK